MVSRTGTAGRSVVSKAAEILLSCLDGSSYSLTEIVDRTGLPRSTAHRLIRELVAWRLLERTAEGDYRTGLPLRLICTRDASVRFDIQECASPILQDLCQILHVEVRLGILNDCNVAYIDCPMGAPSPPSTSQPAFQRMPPQWVKHSSPSHPLTYPSPSSRRAYHRIRHSP
jgi:DNA-binding IclR family transcriptional regulator